MPTQVYGASDDLIEVEGDGRGEIGAYGTDDDATGVLVIMSDGTLLDVQYGKGGKGIWRVLLLQRGSLFDRIDQCDDEDADPHSDVAHFRDGITGAYFATSWGRVT